MAESFGEVITTRERLRELNRHPSHFVSNKTIDHIDDICRRFIAECPFVVIASRGQDNRMDLSPKGDPEGFVAILNEKTLAIPDRLGNNRLDTFENIMLNPEVGLLFIIPGHGDTLRVSGKGTIVRDTQLQNRFAMNGRIPNLVLVIAVEEAFLHCPKCVIRSGLWKPDQWPERSNLPTLAEAMIAHGALSESVEQIETVIQISNTKLLY